MREVEAVLRVVEEIPPGRSGDLRDDRARGGGPVRVVGPDHA